MCRMNPRHFEDGSTTFLRNIVNLEPFKVITAVLMKIKGFWDVTLYRWVFLGVSMNHNAFIFMAKS